MDSAKSKEQKGQAGQGAANDETEAGSFGLHALGELREQEQQPATHQAESKGKPAANDDEGEKNLQSALDWYKDWLSSM